MKIRNAILGAVAVLTCLVAVLICTAVLPVMVAFVAFVVGSLAIQKTSIDVTHNRGFVQFPLTVFIALLIAHCGDWGFVAAAFILGALSGPVVARLHADNR